MRTYKRALTVYRRELALWKVTLGASLETENRSKKEARARETVQARIALLKKMSDHLELIEANF